MKHKIHQLTGVLILAALLYAATSFQLTGFTSQALAACSGTGCNGQFPSSSGCSTNGFQEITYQILPASAQVDLRYSYGCKTSWARTMNVDPRSLFVNATLKGYYNIPSGGKIVTYDAVFTQQRYSATYPPPFQACGYASLTYIPGPVTTPCTP